jgi:hypothetical protein
MNDSATDSLRQDEYNGVYSGCAPKQSSVFTTVFLSLLLSDETVMKEFQTDNRVE